MSHFITDCCLYFIAGGLEAGIQEFCEGQANSNSSKIKASKPNNSSSAAMLSTLSTTQYIFKNTLQNISGKISCLFGSIFFNTIFSLIWNSDQTQEQQLSRKT